MNVCLSPAQQTTETQACTEHTHIHQNIHHDHQSQNPP